MFLNLEDFFVSKARAGVKAKMADIIFGRYFIYVLTPQNNLYPCVLYQGAFSAREYKSPPFVHVCNCGEMCDFYANIDKLYAKIAQSNAFDYKVNLVRSRTIKEFYDVELKICAHCEKIYRELCGEMKNISADFWKIIFSDENVENIEKSAVSDTFLTNKKFSPMDIAKKDGYFSLSYKEAR